MGWHRAHGWVTKINCLAELDSHGTCEQAQKAGGVFLFVSLWNKKKDTFKHTQTHRCSLVGGGGAI